jgi:peptidoglycan/xylan/chitin deacetylase (PgdA/CDA1 family)
MRMALTFDDGPNTTTTMHVLDVLKEYGIRASFFLIGQNITEASRAAIDRQVAEGHSVECHSWTHPFMTKLSAEEIRAEVERTNALIETCTGTPPMFFRPPYIDVNELMYRTIDMPFICGQGVEDWVPEVPANLRAQRLIENAKDGQIVLLHDMEGNEHTVEALKTAIPVLLEKGAEFMTVREIFPRCGVDPHVSGKIWTELLS